MRRLEALGTISQQGKRVNGLFRLMENPILWHEAYANVYANRGALTKGVDTVTLDGFSQQRGEGPFEVHHIRKLKDVAQGKQLWQQVMAARNRKTLVLCLQCHHLLHAGKLPDVSYFKNRQRESRIPSKG
jgi:hypothetical protein